MVSFQQEMEASKKRDQQCHDLWVFNLGREPTSEEDQAWWTNYYQSMAGTYSPTSSSTSNVTPATNDVAEKNKTIMILAMVTDSATYATDIKMHILQWNQNSAQRNDRK